MPVALDSVHVKKGERACNMVQAPEKARRLPGGTHCRHPYLPYLRCAPCPAPDHCAGDQASGQMLQEAFARSNLHMYSGPVARYGSA